MTGPGVRAPIGAAIEWLRPRTPAWLRAGVRRILPDAWRSRVDPVCNPEHIWRLPPPLQGSVFRIRGPVELQYVLPEPGYEPRVSAAIRRYVETGMNCIDVGANIGYMTLLMARCSGPDGRVFAFEALPRNAAALRENVELNGLRDRVLIESLAVGAPGQRTVTLYEGASDFEASVSRTTHASTPLQVPCVDLDSYFAEGPAIGFLKMDIEGGEADAIQGMTGLLRRVPRPVCLIELHGAAGRSVIDVLRRSGYRVCDLAPETVAESLSPGNRHVLALPDLNDS